VEEREQRQLALIGDVARLAAEAGVDCWLRGGWALDFLLGRVTRPHGDIDFFIWAKDADSFARVLEQNGFDCVPGPPPEQQRNFCKGGEELHLGLVRGEASGDVVVAGGPHEGAAWPSGMLGDEIGRIGEITCRIVSAESQLEVKERWEEWTGRAPRDYDAADVMRLRAVLDDARRRG
jgi:hypothetical protein